MTEDSVGHGARLVLFFGQLSILCDWSVVEMKAVVKASPAPGVELREVPIPAIGENDVLIKIKAAAICGSDVHIYKSAPSLMSMIKPPRIFGHEACGEVVDVGRNVRRLSMGDLVATETHIPCGVCFQCQTGGEHVCENVLLYGTHADGAFAEYARAPEVICWKLPKDTLPELGAILEPIGVAVHGVLAGEIGGKSVAVFGCGPIGIFAVQAALALGASRVFASEVSPLRLALARECAPGAIFLNPSEVDLVAAIMAETGGRGVDVALDYTGNADALQLAFKLLRPRGRVSLVGIPAKPIELDLYPSIMLKEAQVFGISGRLMWQTWWQVQDLLETRKIDPLRVITHRFALADFETAMGLAARGEAGKVILYPQGL